MSEDVCKEFYQMFGVKTCSLRIFSAYGEGLKKQLFWDIYQKYMVSKQIELYGTGKETRDFIYIHDLLQALQCVIDNGLFNGDTINISSGIEISIEECAKLFCAGIDNQIEITFNNCVKPGDPLNWRADISIIKSFGFNPFYSMEEGLKNTSKWVKENA